MTLCAFTDTVCSVNSYCIFDRWELSMCQWGSVLKLLQYGGQPLGLVSSAQGTGHAFIATKNSKCCRKSHC